jgi:hypothetical protein
MRVNEIAKIGIFLGEEKKWSSGDFFRRNNNYKLKKKIETVNLIFIKERSFFVFL